MYGQQNIKNGPCAAANNSCVLVCR